jgi:putative metalloprotease
MKILTIVILSILVIVNSGCENTDIRLATEAGVEAYKAVTLSDEAVAELSRQSAEYMDNEHIIAPAGNEYAIRLQSLVGDHYEQDDFTFNYRVYLKDDVNAFALADGTIRLYSGLMDMMDDGELRFVIGHEMGHIVKQHTRNKLRLAYAASAIRKGIASQNNMIASIASSQLGGFVEMLTGAQFSQLEEKVADDYGLSFLKKKGYAPEKAVSALKKLATLGSNHSFLSSHPDPEERAERLSLQIQGKERSIAEAQQEYVTKVKSKLGFIDTLLSKLAEWFPAIFTNPAQ